MEIEFLGQACVLISSGRIRVLCDPWFTTRAHLGGWVAHPEPTPESVEHARSRAETATHIYISHAHEDHFDPEFLRLLTPKEILVGRFRNARFNEALRALGTHHQLRPLAHGKPYDLGGRVAVTIYAEQPDYRTNSVLALEAPEGLLVNANDCGLDSAVLRSLSANRRPLALLYTLNFLANGYPLPYLNHETQDLLERLDTVRNQVVDAFRSAMRALKPRVAFAFAGPVIFADPVNDYLNRHPEARDWTRMVSELADEGRLLWPAPGSVVRVTDDAVDTSGLRRWEGLGSPSTVQTITDDRWASTSSIDETDWDASLQAFAEGRRRLARRLNTRSLPTLVLSAIESIHSLETGSPSWHAVIHLEGDQPRVERLARTTELPSPRLQVLSTPRILHAFVRGEADLDMLLLSGRARFAREPDEFDLALHNVLRFGHDHDSATALVEWAHGDRTRAERRMIEVTVDGVRKQIPNHCPHEGEDWSGVPVVDGLIVCPRHRWKFDVRTGRCVSGDPRVNLFEQATSHYLNDEIDPLFIRASRDHLLRHLQGGRILNVGVGYGVWDERLAERRMDEVTCLDWDADLIREFRRRHSHIDYVHEDIYQYSPKRPFDTICASHFLEHVADPIALLKLWKSWLAPQGRILVAVPNAGSMHRRIGRQMGLLRELTDLNDGDRKLGHQRVYTTALLRDHVDAAGLHIRELRGLTFKALSNAQLARMPRSYVEACVAMGFDDLGDVACQLSAVLSNAPSAHM